MATKQNRRFVIITGDGAILVSAPTRIAALHAYEAHIAKEGPPPVSSPKPIPLEPVTIYELTDEIKGAT
jgi:hypothetical protein